MMEITFFGAFIAGLLSFASPCVLPLIPAYISFLGGASLNQLTEKDGIDLITQRRVFYSACAFVLGFATIFISLGATATAISALIAQHSLLLGQIAGTIIVIFGLHRGSSQKQKRAQEYKSQVTLQAYFPDEIVFRN